MAKHSSIEWTHHTFNPWWGCTKVSPGCKHCYAQTFANRLGQEIWGARARRRFFGDAHWREPLSWNKEARRSKTRRRVFCASMSDVFEDRRELDAPRERLWNLIEETPDLDWLLLTKRPDVISEVAPWGQSWPHNVWLGVTAENQEWARERIPLLLKFPAAVRFVSCEPLLGPLELDEWLNRSPGIDWVIAGGESGHKARPMNPDWARSLRDQCLKSPAAFHFKQWGHWRPDFDDASATSKRVRVPTLDGDQITLVRMGKHAAGRELDGQTWNEFPVAEQINTINR